MHTLLITIQRKVGNGWPLVADLSTPGQFLPMRTEGLLHLDVDTLHSQPTPLAYGTALGQAVFAEPLNRAFVQALAASDNALRVLLYVEADELKSLQWPLLCGPLDGRWSFLVLNQRTLFSLYLPAVTDRRFPSIGRRDLRALAIVASPSGLENYGLAPFDVDKTVAHLRTTFGSMPFDILAAGGAAIAPPLRSTHFVLESWPNATRLSTSSVTARIAKNSRKPAFFSAMRRVALIGLAAAVCSNGLASWILPLVCRILFS